MESCKGRTINNLGGPRAKAGKKTQRLLAQEKKTQLNNPEEKKNSTAGWPGKKSSTASCRGKKKLNANSLPEPPPDH